MSATPSVPTQRARATIRDVAALAGVGIKTVSRVINNEANVSVPTKDRVERAIATLCRWPPDSCFGLRCRSGPSSSMSAAFFTRFSISALSIRRMLSP